VERDKARHEAKGSQKTTGSQPPHDLRTRSFVITYNMMIDKDSTNLCQGSKKQRMEDATTANPITTTSTTTSNIISASAGEEQYFSEETRGNFSVGATSFGFNFDSDESMNNTSSMKMAIGGGLVSLFTMSGGLSLASNDYSNYNFLAAPPPPAVHPSHQLADPTDTTILSTTIPTLG
jgi:hypothetical protein